MGLGDRFFRDQADGALDPRIDQEAGAGVVADGLDHRLDVGADEIEHRLVAGRVLRLRRRHAGEQAQHEGGGADAATGCRMRQARCQ